MEWCCNTTPQNKTKPETICDERLRHGFARLVRYNDGRLSFQVVRSEKLTDESGHELIDSATSKPKRAYFQVYLDPADMSVLGMIAERFQAEQRKSIMGGDA